MGAFNKKRNGLFKKKSSNEDHIVKQFYFYC